MASIVEIRMMGIPEFKRFMEDKQTKFKKILPEGLREATLLMHGQIKESIARGTNAAVAVDTGRFLNSIDFDSTENMARVFTNIEYAKFIEYGTSKMSARPHFRNTADVLKAGIREVMAVKIKSI